MKIKIDLKGLKTEDAVLHKFGELFEFGGPNGNISTGATNERKGWGLNWDAFNDSLYLIEEGGIWGTSKQFKFPLEIELSNLEEFKNNDPKSFKILMEILDDHIAARAKEGKVLKVVL